MATFKYAVKANGNIIPANTEVELDTEKVTEVPAEKVENTESVKSKRTKKKAADEQ